MKECTPTGDCHFNKFRQNQYFHGMLLDDKDFRDAHEYHAQKRRLLNRMLHGSGAVCGLCFSNDERTITISCGLALDCAGQEIYVPSDVTVAVPVPRKEPKEACAPTVDTEVCYRIRIAYTDEDTDFTQVHLPGGGCDDKTCKATRKREGFCIQFKECECPQDRKPIDSEDCEDLIGGFNKPIECGCGCNCSCGTEHWVTLGNVKVSADGKIIGKATYDCRDYVFSGQMLKQIFTRVPPPSGECACPDQFDRLKELLSLICSNHHSLEQSVSSVKESTTRVEEAMDRNFAIHDAQILELRRRIPREPRPRGTSRQPKPDVT